MSADTTGIVLKTGTERPEWRVAIVQNAEDMFDFEPSSAQVEAGRAYTGSLLPSDRSVSDRTARLMSRKALHVENAEAGAPIKAPGRLNVAYVQRYFAQAAVLPSPESARELIEALERDLELDGGYLEYGIVTYETPEEFPRAD